MNEKYLVINTYHSSRDITQEIQWATKEELDDMVNCERIINKQINLIKEDESGVLYYQYHDTADVKDSQDLQVHYLDYYIAIPEQTLNNKDFSLLEYIMETNNKHGIVDTINGQASWAGHR
jgi:hypothetical protein